MLVIFDAFPVPSPFPSIAFEELYDAGFSMDKSCFEIYLAGGVQIVGASAGRTFSFNVGIPERIDIDGSAIAVT